MHRSAPCRPDLILMDDRGRLQVIDIKASEELSTSHRIQATLYALILDHASTSSASIFWSTAITPPYGLHGQTAPNPSTSTSTSGLPRSSSATASRRPQPPGIRSRLAHHPRCESCGFYTHCRAEAEQTLSVSLIPGLSTAARPLPREASPPIETLPDLAEFLKDPAAEPYLDGCGSAAGEREDLQAVVRALLSGEVVPLPADRTPSPSTRI